MLNGPGMAGPAVFIERDFACRRPIGDRAGAGECRRTLAARRRVRIARAHRGTEGFIQVGGHGDTGKVGWARFV